LYVVISQLLGVLGIVGPLFQQFAGKPPLLPSSPPSSEKPLIIQFELFNLHNSK
jgi:hypothetical protein